MKRFILAAILALAAPLGNAQDSSALTVHLTWNDGKGNANGTVNLTQTVFDPVAQTYSQQPTSCNAAFSGGSVTCHIALLTDTLYTVNLAIVNPVTHAPVALSIPLLLPSGFMPGGILKGTYKSTIDVNTNQSVPGTTAVSVVF